MNHFLLVGAGGTASYLFPVLYRYLQSEYGDDYMLAVVDADVVNTENLARQNHGRDSVGMNKAQALVGSLPNTVAVPEYLGPNNIRFIEEDTTVIITVDNFAARARIQDRANELNNVTVINAGNEEHTASVQLWIRQNGENITPPLGFLHSEIRDDGEDRATMSCEDIAALPGGGQTAIANYTSANMIMLALNQRKSTEIRWHELHIDALTGTFEPIDYRESKAWSLFSSPSASSPSSGGSARRSSGLVGTVPEAATPSTTRSSRPRTRRS